MRLWLEITLSAPNIYISYSSAPLIIKKNCYQNVCYQQFQHTFERFTINTRGMDRGTSTNSSLYLCFGIHRLHLICNHRRKRRAALFQPDVNHMIFGLHQYAKAQQNPFLGVEIDFVLDSRRLSQAQKGGEIEHGLSMYAVHLLLSSTIFQTLEYSRRDSGQKKKKKGAVTIFGSSKFSLTNT